MCFPLTWPRLAYKTSKMDLAFTPACMTLMHCLTAFISLLVRQHFGNIAQLLYLCFRSDCLIKTIRSEGYFGMYRGEVKIFTQFYLSGV